MRLPSTLLISLASLLAGCDMLGIESASAVSAKREGEGKAVGSACRHAGRALEDCYVLNKRADKGAVFAGWREMNDYMRENKIEEITPQLPPPGSEKKLAKADEEDEEPPAKKATTAPAAPAPAKKAPKGG